jgi:predicted TIM-barrel fold metal-dependent hydrolase
VPRVVDLRDLPVVDGHCHPLLPDARALSAEKLLDLMSEGRPGSMAAHVPHTGYFARALRDLARLYGTEPTIEAVLARRTALGPEAAGRALGECLVTGLLVDTGYPPDAMSLDEMRRRLPSPIHEVFRIETCAQAMLEAALPCDAFLAAFRQRLQAAAETAVALKTIIAYRSGLAIRPWPRADVAEAYGTAAARVRRGGSPRLTEKPLLDTLFLAALEVAAETARPLQIHTGFGDPDIDLLQANPLLLRPLLEGSHPTAARLVLLHMAYPYVREAAFMAAVWPQVSVDLSLAIPFLGPGAVPPLIELLSLAPASKLLYGSDVGALPELLAVVADWGRAALGEALGWLVERGGLGEEEAQEAGGRILSGNARALYRLPAATSWAGARPG